MSKQLFIMNNSNNILSKKYINNLILEINKLDINKIMKEILLIASTNLLSPTKTSKGLIYQLDSFKKQESVFPEKTKSKYLNSIIKDLKSLPKSDFISNIDNLKIFLESNNINITVKPN